KMDAHYPLAIFVVFAMIFLVDPLSWRIKMFNPLSSKVMQYILMTSVLPLILMTASAQAQDNSQWGSGKNLYKKVCGHCHAPEVGVGPVIEGRGLPEAYVKFIVRNGFNAMPAFPASYVDDKSVAQVTEYLSTLPAPAAQP